MGDYVITLTFKDSEKDVVDSFTSKYSLEPCDSLKNLLLTAIHKNLSGKLGLSGFKIKSGGRPSLSPGESARNSLYRSIKRMAVRKHKNFTLTMEEFIKITSSNCFKCDSPPSYSFNAGNTIKTPYVYSRIKLKDYNKDYTPDNCIPTCSLCKRKRYNDGLSPRQLKLSRMKRIGPRLPPGIAARNHYYTKYRLSAKRRGLDFLLPLDRFTELTSDKCYYCHCPPSNRYDASGVLTTQYICNGIDRVDNDVGYVEGNCVPCCTSCNFSKGNKSSKYLLDTMGMLDKL